MRNDYYIKGNIVHIELNNQGAETVISLDKLEKLLTLDVKWRLLDQGGHTCYAVSTLWNKETKTSKTLRLHRFLLDLESDLVVNHIDGDGLNNTTENLEAVTVQVNTIKRARLNNNNTSGVRGVYYSRKERRWVVRFQKDYVMRRFGSYKTKEEAARVASDVIKEFFSDKVEGGL